MTMETLFLLEEVLNLLLMLLVKLMCTVWPLSLLLNPAQVVGVQ